MKIQNLFLTAVLAALSMPGFAWDKTLETESAGTVSVICPETRGWNIETAVTSLDGKEYIKLTLDRQSAAEAPYFSINFSLPQKDMQHLWSCVNSDRCQLKPDWACAYESNLAQSMPIYEFFSECGENRLLVASNEAFRRVRANLGLREEGALCTGRIEYFIEPEAPMTHYETTLLLDARKVFWAEPIKEASEWISTSAGLEPCPVPEAAYEPLYSSWYQFHQNVFDKDIEEECKLASEAGMKTIILDDGWQTDDNNRGYAFCGDWKVSPRRFPDMAAHVEKVHKTGMKYMVWFSVPFIGINSKAYNDFRGKYLYDETGLGCSVLDPRFPEVREWLASLYEARLKEWNIDGFKLDFIDEFHISGTDPAIAQNYAGRDIKSVPEAVNALMKDVLARLQAINPDILVEFRQSYVGPAIRQFGNMLRAADCPGDLAANRARIANLRLTSGETAVHADMLEWNMEESVEQAARNIIASMFGVVQYSVMLRDIPKEHRAMIGNWLNFLDEHRATLLKGEFRPYHPESNFPVIEAESGEELICAVYEESRIASAGNGDKTAYVINGSCADKVAVEFQARPRKVVRYDVFGKKAGRAKARKGIRSIEVPVGGYIKITY